MIYGYMVRSGIIYYTRVYIYIALHVNLYHNVSTKITRIKLWVFHRQASPPTLRAPLRRTFCLRFSVSPPRPRHPGEVIL